MDVEWDIEKISVGGRGRGREMRHGRQQRKEWRSWKNNWKKSRREKDDEAMKDKFK